MNCTIGMINPTEKTCAACGHRCTAKGLSEFLNNTSAKASARSKRGKKSWSYTLSLARKSRQTHESVGEPFSIDSEITNNAPSIAPTVAPAVKSSYKKGNSNIYILLSAQLAYAISCLGSGDTEKAKDIILRLAEVIR